MACPRLTAGSSQGQSVSLSITWYPSAYHRVAVVNTFGWVGRAEAGQEERWHYQVACVEDSRVCARATSFVQVCVDITN